MAWPNDARHTTNAAGKMWASATSNEVQDRVVDLHRDRIMHPSQVIPDNGTSWVYDAAAGWWICPSGVGFLQVIFDLAAGAIIKTIETMIEPASGAGIASRAWFQNLSTSYAVASAITGSDLATTVGWDNSLFTGLAHTVVTGQRIYVHIDANTANDKFYFARMTVQPLTPTP